MAEKLDKLVKPFKESEYLWCKEESLCWVERDAGDHLANQDVFVAAVLLKFDSAQQTAIVKYETKYEGPTDVHLTRISNRDPNKYPNLSDLVDLQILNDAELHEKIKERFQSLNIFTYIGPSLLILNPFKYLKN